MSGLYQSGWNPRGSRKAWDRCSMDLPSTAKAIGHWAESVGGKMVEAVGWFDEEGRTRIVVADFDNGKRFILRKLARGSTVTIERRP